MTAPVWETSAAQRARETRRTMTRRAAVTALVVLVAVGGLVPRMATAQWGRRGSGMQERAPAPSYGYRDRPIRRPRRAGTLHPAGILRPAATLRPAGTLRPAATLHPAVTRRPVVTLHPAVTRHPAVTQAPDIRPRATRHRPISRPTPILSGGRVPSRSRTTRASAGRGHPSSRDSTRTLRPPASRGGVLTVVPGCSAEWRGARNGGSVGGSGGTGKAPSIPSKTATGGPSTRA